MHITDTNYFAAPNYSEYVSDVKYTQKSNYTTSTAEEWINYFIHYLFDRLTPDIKGLPEGYVVEKNDSLYLGPKVEANDWSALLAHYWVVLVWFGFMLILVIIIPCIAVCYACFGCFRCGKEGCPPCDTETNARKRCCFSYMIIWSIVFILFGVIICISSNKALETAVKRTTYEVESATRDTCTYLKDVTAHIQYLLINNYEELCTQTFSVLSVAHTTMYYAFLDNAGLGHIYPLCERLEDMPKALVLMKSVNQLIEDLRLYGAQFRDGLRTIKRDITYIMNVLCGNADCLRFLVVSQIETIDNSKCLHFDGLSDTLKYTAAMKHIIDMDAASAPRQYITRIHQTFWKDVRELIEPRKNLIERDLNEGKDIFRMRADTIRSVIDSVINEIYAKTYKSTGSFNDVDTKFGDTRSALSACVCWLLTVIMVFLIIGVICGCCGRHRRERHNGFCNKRTGSIFLLMAIVLIFCVFSFVTLVGMFYFVIGLLTYQGGCAPLRDLQNNTIFRYLDAAIDLNQYQSREIPGQEEPPIPPLRMSSVAKSLSGKNGICDLLKMSSVYDINELSSIEIMHEYKDVPWVWFWPDHENKTGKTYSFQIDTSKFKYLDDNDMKSYNSSNIINQICKELTPLDLNFLAKQLLMVRSTLWSQWGIYDWARLSLDTEAANLRYLNDVFYGKITSIMDEIISKLNQIDKIILLNSSYLYGQSVDKIYDKMRVGERYLWDWGEDHYQSEAVKLHGFVNEFVTIFKKKVQNDFCTKVGINVPIASAYNNSVELICDRLINPLNRFWVGLLLGSLFLLPVLYFAHRLVCINNKIMPSPDITVYSCPVCTGQPFTGPVNEYTVA